MLPLNNYSLDNFVQRADQFKLKRDIPYITFHIDLATARNNFLINISGDIIKVLSASDNTANIDLRLNLANSPAIPMLRYRKVKTFFDKIYITNTAQEGLTLDLILGVAQYFDIEDFFFRVAPAEYGLPYTGQLIVYSPDDDGAYQKGYTLARPIVKGVGSNRFEIRSGGLTVFDRATGLEWVRDPINDIGASFNGAQWWNFFILACEALNFAGHADWRMPNIQEIHSILDYELIAPAIDAVFFPNTEQNSYYWSSTTYISSTDYAWCARFGNPTQQLFPRRKNPPTAPEYCRPVRLGLPV